jgi:Carboxymuconolactone decarboxylase family
LVQSREKQTRIAKVLIALLISPHLSTALKTDCLRLAVSGGARPTRQVHGIRDTCRTALLLLFQKRRITHAVLKEKQKMTPVIAPCEPPYSAGVTDDLAALMPPGAPPIALFRVLAHNPRILSRFRAGRLLDAGALSARERELLILRVCHRCDCDYEWSVHVAGFADAAGLAEADLHATLRSTAEAPLSRRERLMLAAADELVDARS